MWFVNTNPVGLSPPTPRQIEINKRIPQIVSTATQKAGLANFFTILYGCVVTGIGIETAREVTHNRENVYSLQAYGYYSPRVFLVDFIHRVQNAVYPLVRLA